MRNKLARPGVFCVFRSACRLLICLAAVALALPISQGATPHPQISFIQLKDTSGCVGDGGSFYPSFDRLVKKGRVYIIVRPDLRGTIAMATVKCSS